MVQISRTTVRGVPVLAGAVAGIVAYAVGFAATAALYTVAGTKPLIGVLGKAISTGAEYGFTFYGAHLVPTSDGVDTLNYATEVAEFGTLYVMLVALILAATGYHVATRVDSDVGRATRLGAGASLALGYLPLAVLGGAYFTGNVPAWSTPLTLPMVRVVALAGLAFPVGFGALGGLLAHENR